MDSHGTLGATDVGNYTTYVSDKAGIYNYTVKVRDNHSGEAIGNVTVYVFDAEIEIPDAPSGEEIQDPVNPNNPVNADLSGEKLIEMLTKSDLNEIVRKLNR